MVGCLVCFGGVVLVGNGCLMQIWNAESGAEVQTDPGSRVGPYPIARGWQRRGSALMVSGSWDALRRFRAVFALKNSEGRTGWHVYALSGRNHFGRFARWRATRGR